MGTVHKLSPSREPVTLERAAAAYLATLDHPESRNTHRAYASALRALVAEFGAGTDVAALTGHTVPAWFTRQWGGKAPATWNSKLVAIRSAFAYWRDQGWTSADPADPLRQRRKAVARDRALSPSRRGAVAQPR